MKVKIFDYHDYAQYTADKADGFSGRYASCMSDWNDTDNISIGDISSDGEFRILFNADGTSRWWIGYQHIFVIVNEDGEEVYVPPYEDIAVRRGPPYKKRVRQVREDLLALCNNDWKEERDMNAYIKDCDADYMPDIF